jgi:hypothetical protein
MRCIKPPGAPVATTCNDVTPAGTVNESLTPVDANVHVTTPDTDVQFPTDTADAGPAAITLTAAELAAIMAILATTELTRILKTMSLHSSLVLSANVLARRLGFASNAFHPGA